MSQTPSASRATSALTVVLIVLPLVITAVIKYLPALTEHQNISSVGIMNPRLIVPKEFLYLESDVARRLRAAVAEVPGLQLRETNEGVDAFIEPTLTIDAGIVQLNLRIIQASTKRVVFNTPYQSSIDNYPNMMNAACAALKRALK